MDDSSTIGSSLGHRAASQATTRRGHPALAVFAILLGCISLAALLVQVMPDAAGPSPGESLPPAWKVVLVAAILVAFALALAVHEAGHVLGGRMAGFRFSLLAFGPLRIERAAERIRWARNRNPVHYGGFAVCIPAGGPNLRRGMVLFVAAGPVASLLVGAAALGVRAGLGLDASGSGALVPGAYIAGEALQALGIASLLLGIATLIPMRFGGLASDGRQLLDMLGSSAEAERAAAVMALHVRSAGGERPRDWSLPLLERALALPDGSVHDVAAQVLAYRRALDLGDLGEAEGCLRRALDRIDDLPSGQAGRLALEAAFFTAAYRGDAAGARAWLARAGGVTVLLEPHARWCAEAAIFAAEGNAARAVSAAARAEEELAGALDVGSAQARTEALRALLSRLPLHAGGI